MAGLKFLNLLAVSSLAVICSLAPTSVGAVATDGHANVARHHQQIARAHDAVSKRKRAGTKRCKPRTASSIAAPAPTSVKAPVKVDATPTPSPIPTPTPEAPKPSAEAPKPSPDAPKPPKPVDTPKPEPPKPAPEQPSSGGGSTGAHGKVGISWPNSPDISIAPFASDKLGHCYTWSPYTCHNGEKNGIASASMLWGWKQVGDFQNQVINKPGKVADVIMGMNEPNEPSQSNMSPESGAELWMKYIQPLASRGYKLVSPAVTSAPDGIVWMEKFFAACHGCTFDFVALHYYDTSADAFIKYVENFHNAFGKPIWVTEYACQNFGGGAQCNKGQMDEFTNKWLNFANSTPWIAEYYPFGWMHDMVGVNPLNQLMNGAGKPTDLAWRYIGN